MNIEENRLRTFESWPANAAVEPRRLARTGFFYTGHELEIQCFCCGGKITDLNYGDVIMLKHRKLDPNCPFIVNPNNSGNIPLLNTPINVSSSNVIANENTRNVSPIENDPLHNSSSSTSPMTLPSVSTSFIRTLNNLMTDEAERLATFTNWPIPEIVQPQRLAMAGFFYLKETDKVRCAYCNGIVGRWEIGDDPVNEHRRHFPSCQFARRLTRDRRSGERMETDTSNNVSTGVPNVLDNEKMVGHDNYIELGIQAHTAPRYSKYATLDSRLKTFTNWPNLVQTPEILAEAGFFYTGITDQVRCFHCDGGLRHWDPDDVPWEEHARWFPQCDFVQLVKGASFVVTSKQSNIDFSFRESSSGQNCGVTFSQRNPTNTEVEQLLNTPIVKTALEVGIQIDRIKQAIQQRLATVGVPFTTPDALIEAALNLQWEDSEPSNENEHCSELSKTLNSLMKSAESDIKFGWVAPTKKAEAEVKSDDNKNLPDKKPEENETPLTLEEENRRLKDARLCKICLDKEVGVVFLPCGHLATCVHCAPSLVDCPVCRSPIKANVRTFFS